MSTTPRIDRLENAIINAPMEFWQRVGGNTTTVNTASPTAAYTVDRMLYGTNGTTVKNFSVVRDGSDAPVLLGTGNQPVAYSYKFSCLTAIVSPASTDVVTPWQYRMEGYDYAIFHANAATFSFWIKVTSTATFPISVPVAFGNGSRSYVTTVQVNANSTWQQCVVNLTMDSAGGYAFDNTLGLKITIAAGAAGSGFISSTPNAWVNGDLFSVTGAFNSMGVNTNVVHIAAPQFMLGTRNIPIFARAGNSVAHELQMCQRYYEKSYDVDTVPGAINAPGAFWVTSFNTTQQEFMTVMYKVAKRASPPAVTGWSYGNGVSGNWWDTTLGAVNGNISVFSSGAQGFAWNSSTTFTAGHIYAEHWTSDAEL